MSDPHSLPTIDATDAVVDHAAGTLTLVDLRKSPARVASGEGITGAAWVDPFALGHAHALMSGAERIGLFCVHGHEVSQYGCALLRLHGRDAVYVRGGFEALVAAGAPLEAISDAGQGART
ncbi:MAG: sulfurtransferase [Pseudomonadota bacterium]